MYVEYYLPHCNLSYLHFVGLYLLCGTDTYICLRSHSNFRSRALYIYLFMFLDFYLLLRTTYIYVDTLITNVATFTIVIVFIFVSMYLGCRDSPAIQIVLLFIQ